MQESKSIIRLGSPMNKNSLEVWTKSKRLCSGTPSTTANSVFAFRSLCTSLVRHASSDGLLEQSIGCGTQVGELLSSAVLTRGKKMRVSVGIVQLRVTDPPAVPARNQTSLPAPSAQSSPVLSNTGLRSDGIARICCHQATLHCARLKPPGRPSGGTTPGLPRRSTASTGSAPSDPSSAVLPSGAALHPDSTAAAMTQPQMRARCDF